MNLKFSPVMENIRKMPHKIQWLGGFPLDKVSEEFQEKQNRVLKKTSEISYMGGLEDLFINLCSYNKADLHAFFIYSKQGSLEAEV